MRKHDAATPSRKRRRGWRVWGPPAAAALSMGLVVLLYRGLLGGADGPRVEPSPVRATTYERTAELRPLSLPQDEGPHVSATEWWYYNGQLFGEDGEAHYSFHVTVFLRDGMVRHTVFHLSLTDHRSGVRHERQLRTAGIPSATTQAGFDFDYEGWRVRGDGQQHAIAFSDDEIAIDLTLADTAAPMLHREKGSQTPGLLDFGDAGISYYYSRPRLATQGSVAMNGADAVPVRGEVWYDHQWGDFEGSRLAWNWFALQLDDGSNLMVYQLFDAAGAHLMTNATRQSGDRLIAMNEEEVRLVPHGGWTSAASGVTYPAAWTLTLPEGELTLRPLRLESEFNGLETTFKYYWEGPVSIEGVLGGKGFLEMSGYDHIAVDGSQTSQP